jgi:PEP-CTERM motif
MGKKLVWDGIVTMVVDLVNGKSFDIVFAGDTKNDDVGAIGFDELNEPGFLVKSVSMNLDATGAWNEVKQFDFSVPGAVPTIPEPSTWAMMLLGFAGLGFAGYRKARSARTAVSAA